MSRHEGVSCDACMNGNFKGRRYKCLVCFDYDLCATCYEAGAATTRHTTDHAMQCILTRQDFDLYYSGEAVTVENPQAFTCPFCAKMGFTEATLQEHVASEHSDASYEVVCPICASLPGGEPNHLTDDFAAHLTVEHRSPRELEEPSGSRPVRRIPHPGRSVASARPRRTQMQYGSSAGLSSLSPSSRESMDPIAELLSQLSGVRRTTNLAQSNTNQLQQLQMQLQLERQQAQAARQQLERLPRRQPQGTTAVGASLGVGSTAGFGTTAPSSGASASQSHYVTLEPSASPASTTAATGSQFLLSRCTETQLNESEQEALEIENSNRSLFVQELLLTTLAEQLKISDNWDSICKNVQVIEEGYPALVSESSNLKEGSSDPNFPLASSADSPSQSASSGLHSHQRPQNLIQQNSVQQVHCNSVSRKSPSSSSSAAISRQNSRTSNCNAQQSPQPWENSGPPNVVGRGSGGSGNNPVPQRLPSRDGHSGGRNVNRTNSRDGGTSPSSTRRKVIRQHKSSDPPPPH